jgi:hypothetical protein
MPVDFSRFMVSGRGNRFEPLPETVIPRLKMPVVAEPAPAPAPAPAMPGTPVDLSRLDLSNLNIPMPVPQPIPQPVPQPIPAPAPPPVEVAPPPPPIPQISPEVLAQIQQQFNLPDRFAPPPPPVAPLYKYLHGYATCAARSGSTTCTSTTPSCSTRTFSRSGNANAVGWFFTGN